MKERPLQVAFIGRLTGPKGDLARRLVTEVFPRFPRIRFSVVGGPLDETWQGGANVQFTGWVSDMTPILAHTDLVIASGRSALEALHAGIPVMAVGEACYVGFVDTENFDEARRTNFGDCESGNQWQLDAMLRDLAKFEAGYRPDTESLPELLAPYAAPRVAAAVEKVYTEAWLERRLATRRIPILCYHRVLESTPEHSRLSIHVTRDQLDGHLRQLRRRGMTTITFSDLLEARPLPKRPVILTFDDGYRDNFEHLLPLLEHHHARAVIFVLGDRRLRVNAWDAAHGEPEAPLMDDAQVRACVASGHVEIGSHGLVHAHLVKLDDQTLTHELETSKSTLEAITGAPVTSFAYPYGEWTRRERDAVAAAGYAFGLATDRGAPLAQDRFAVARRIVFPATTYFGFYKKSSNWYPRYRHLLGRPA